MPDTSWKFAVLTGKKLGSAPLRNRHKRWAREAFRQARPALGRPGRLVLRFNQPQENFANVRNAFLEAYQIAIQNSDRVA